MSKLRTRFICQKCGNEAARWLGRCPDCGEWNSFLEETVADRPPASAPPGFAAPRSAPQPIASISMEAWARSPSGISEFDRVLGGGIVPGSLVLIGGDPGIGKCVTGDTRVLDPESGAYLPITAWATGKRAVLAVEEESLRFGIQPVAAFHERGRYPVLQVKTKLGRSLRCTPDHPVLTPEGWQPIHGLTVGTRVAAPRALPYFGAEELPEATVKLIAYVLSDGSAQSQISVTNHLPEVARDLEEIATAFRLRLVCYDKPGNRAKQYRLTLERGERAKSRQALAAALRVAHQRLGISWQEWARRAGVGYSLLNAWRRASCAPSERALACLAAAVGIPVDDLSPDARHCAEMKTSAARLLEEVGLRYRRAAEKAIPDCIFRLPRLQLALFLRTLFTCDGSVYVSRREQAGVSYSTISHRLAQDVQHLLLRFGFVATLRTKKTRVNDRPYVAFEVVLLGRGNVYRFLGEIGIGGRETACNEIARTESARNSSTHRDTIPTGEQFWTELKSATGGASYREISSRAGVTLRNRRQQGPLCRTTVEALSAVFPTSRLRALASGEVYWDEIASIEPDGDAPVFDLTVRGPANFVANDLVIHNSTLLMQASGRLALGAGRTLYVTGEESTQQVKLRAERLDTLAPELYLSAETDIDVIEAHAQNLKPRFLVVDSIQTVHDASIGSAPGTVSQVRACCARLMRLAKTTHTTVFIVGHVTKEGAIAGPRVLEHMVDVVLYFEGDRFQSYRVLRGVKNRFGSTDEIGLFEMTDAGLREVAGASELFLSQRPEQGPGSAVAAIIEGTRPLLVEVQALVARSYLASPRRTTTGIDYNRVCMILAVLEKRCGMRMSDKDVYVNVAGGLKVVEPAIDLPVAVALASSFKDRAVDPSIVIAGEVGLAGEVRSVHQTDRRLKEAQRMGFTRALAPGPRGSNGYDGLEVTEVRSVSEAVQRALDPARREGEAEDAFAEPFEDDET
jgi:DNA repair protein RadA/Sms